MKVGLVTPYYPKDDSSNSGIANHFFLLAQALHKAGNPVAVLFVEPCEDSDVAGVCTFEENGVSVTTFKIAIPAFIKLLIGKRWSFSDLYYRMASMIHIYFYLPKWIQRHNIQVIETSSYFSLTYLYLFRKKKPPIVTRVSTTFKQMVTEHYPFKSKLLDFIANIELLNIKKGKTMLTHSEAHLQELDMLYDIDKQKFSIIPHGIDLPELPSSHQSETIRVLYVGRFEERKGTDLLFQAIAKVIANSPNILFELAGGDELTYNQEFADQQTNDTLAKVNFLGKVSKSKLNELFAQCDIFVAPSRYESFGLIYIEAMSHGKPVIGCRVGGVKDIIEDGINGLFAELSGSDIANKILQLSGSKELRDQLGTNARKCVEAKFTKEIMASKSLELYQSLL